MFVSRIASIYVRATNELLFDDRTPYIDNRVVAVGQRHSALRVDRSNEKTCAERRKGKKRQTCSTGVADF